MFYVYHTMILEDIHLKLRSSILSNHLRSCKCSYSHTGQDYGGNVRKKFSKFRLPKRPHKPTRNELRTPIPFLEQMKQSQDADEALSMFHQYHATGYNHSYPSYASLIYKLARAKKFESVDSILYFLKTHDVRCQEALFIALIRHYGKAQLVEKAVDIFQEMGKGFNCVRTVQSFNTLLNVLVDNDRVCEAIELFKDGHSTGFRLNSVSFNVMIKMWLKKGEWEKANELFDEMLERNVEPSVVTYNSRIGFLCRKGDIDDAKSLFEDMQKIGRKPNAVTYALLMEGLCGKGNFRDAEKMMFDMEYQGCKVELVNYGVLMSNLVDRGLIDEAKGLLSEMKKRRIKADVVMYNILIGSLCQGGAASDGYKLLLEMQVSGLEPNAATYRMVVDGFCRENDFVSGLKVFNAMMYSKHVPRDETLGCLVVGLFRCGEMNDACFVLEEMYKRKIRLSLSLWESLVTELCFDEKPVIELLTNILLSVQTNE